MSHLHLQSKLEASPLEGAGEAEEASDSINEHLRRWELTLSRLDPRTPFVIPLGTIRSDDPSVFDHFIVFHEYRGVPRLVEVKLLDSPPGASRERPLAAAPRAVRLEVLRRLPKAYEGVTIRNEHAAALLL